MAVKPKVGGQDGTLARTGRAGGAARRMRCAVAGAVLAAGLMLGTPKAANADSIELMAGNKNTTMDLKASASIAERLGVFIRARPSVDYSGEISTFGLMDLSVGLGGGLDAVGEVQAAGGSVVPRAGLQYFIRTGDFSLYALGTAGLDAAPCLEALVALRYAPMLRGSLRLLAAAEDVTDARPAGHIFSTQRIRLGLEWKGWGAGAAADLTETGNRPDYDEGSFGYNAGGFLSKTF